MRFSPHEVYLYTSLTWHSTVLLLQLLDRIYLSLESLSERSIGT